MRAVRIVLGALLAAAVLFAAPTDAKRATKKPAKDAVTSSEPSSLVDTLLSQLQGMGGGHTKKGKK